MGMLRPFLVMLMEQHKAETLETQTTTCAGGVPLPKRQAGRPSGQECFEKLESRAKKAAREAKQQLEAKAKSASYGLGVGA